MDYFEIEGGYSLEGEIEVSAAKNSCLPLMAATLLFSEQVAFSHLPNLRDIKTMSALLNEMGVSCEQKGNDFFFSPQNLSHTVAPYERVKTMRASILVLGPLLARCGEAQVSLPGGCAIGARPIDIHLDALEKMGAKIKIENGYVVAKAQRLKGCSLCLPFPSVGATENILMAAALAEGETTLENAAREPEIGDLIDFLKLSGIVITGEGSSRLVIKGILPSEIKAPPEIFRPMADRIEAATYLIAASITRSKITIKGQLKNNLGYFLEVLKTIGVEVQVDKDVLRIKEIGLLKALDVETAPFPGFPTDAQAQMMVLLGQASGTSILTETIFENRFMHVPELNRMGAKIGLQGRKALIPGPVVLKGAPVMCTDLRASAALILAGLIADGKTRVERVYHVDRGYESIEKKLQQLGAKILRKS